MDKQFWVRVPQPGVYAIPYFTYDNHEDCLKDSVPGDTIYAGTLRCLGEIEKKDVVAKYKKTQAMTEKALDQGPDSIPEL